LTSTKKSLRTLARVLFLVGGLLLILGAALQLGVGLTGLSDFAFRIPSLGSVVGLIIAVLAGLLALAGIGQVSNAAWDIVILILGFLAGGLGGILVIIGALIALVAIFV
jgi:hypothetical protein